MKRTPRAFVSLFAGLTTLIAVVAVLGTAPASADINGCPTSNGIGSRPTSNLVGASSSVSGNDATYTFTSFTDESPSGGIPGLIEYCIYPGTQPDSVTTVAVGDDASAWTDPPSFDNFSFQRPDGNPSNIGLDGSAHTMGTATWSGGVPADQIILLHINDEAECNALGQNAQTCFVFPGSPQAPKAKSPTVDKTAQPSSTDTFGWGISKDVDQTKIDIADGGTATFNYTVSVTHDSGTLGDWKVSGSITVTNPNATDSITLSGVSDSVNDANASCTVDTSGGLSVAPGSTSFPYECDYAAAPSASGETNTATISWGDQTLPSDGLLAAGSATKDVDFTFGSPTPVNGCVDVTDTLGGSLGTVCSTDPSPTTFTYAHEFSGVGGTCRDYDNTATLSTGQSASKTVTVCVGEDLTVSKDATPSFDRLYTWGISKSVDQTTIDIANGGTATFNYTVSVTHDSGTDSGWKVTGTITVTNPNDWEAITANVSDAVDNGGTCTVTPASLTVQASDSAQASYECDYASAPSPSNGTNTATATWDPDTYVTPSGSANGTATFDFGSVSPSITDDTVVVNDTLGGTLGLVSSTDPSPTTFTYSHGFPGVGGTCTNYNNTATFTTNDTGSTSSASQSVKVCVGLDLSVSKTANPSFTRTYTWGISKSVDKTLVEQLGGGSAAFTYTVSVTHNSGTDGNWKVTGTITVTNPNDWEAITANLSDAVDNGGTCVVTNGTNVSIAAGGSATRNYTCTYSSAPSPSSGTNTATATWDKAAAFTPDGSKSGTATFTFASVSPTIVDGTIVVNDTLGGTLGTATYTDPSPKTFTYQLTFTVPTTGCQFHTNTASFVTNSTGTTGSASQTVELCGPAKTGALTMGYWQNKNGQGIITSGQSVGGVCKSGTWLRGFAPFQDLSASATCSQVATYVYNVVKAANAGGSAMNPMLKAQMLATALDAYFSDVALGGNKISAPAAIGGFSIDLTKICKMIDSGGGGSCSGAFESVSGAFGGATSMTVSQMLAYAASQSNAGGSTWYGQVKATQGLAKDAFDAINNQVVFSP